MGFTTRRGLLLWRLCAGARRTSTPTRGRASAITERRPLLPAAAASGSATASALSPQSALRADSGPSGLRRVSDFLNTRLQTDGDAVRHRLSRHQRATRQTTSNSKHQPPRAHAKPNRTPPRQAQPPESTGLRSTTSHDASTQTPDTVTDTTSRRDRRAHTQGAHSQSHRHSRQHSDSQDAKSSALQTVSAHRTYNPHDTSSRRDGHRAWPCALMVDSCARRPICHMQPHTAR